jgi:hypothetical protein
MSFWFLASGSEVWSFLVPFSVWYSSQIIVSFHTINDVLSSLQEQSNSKMIVNHEFKELGRKISWPNLRNCPDIFLWKNERKLRKISSKVRVEVMTTARSYKKASFRSESVVMSDKRSSACYRTSWSWLAYFNSSSSKRLLMDKPCIFLPILKFEISVTLFQDFSFDLKFRESAVRGCIKLDSGARSSWQVQEERNSL